MSLVYLGALLAGCVCMCALDRRFGLFLWRAPARALVVQAVGVGALVTWDLVCIALGIFQRGTGGLSTGIELAPHLPLEEPVFLWFLCHFTMILFTGASRLLPRAVSESRRAPASEPGSIR